MLHVNDLTYRLGARTLFDKATVAIPSGARVGFVGRNGTGKTTLFRMIRGEISPEGGSIAVGRGLRIGSVAQEAPGGPETLTQVVLAADVERESLLAEAETATDPHRIAEIQTRLVDIGAHAAPAKAAAILYGLGFDAEAQARPCSSFSGGWRMRVALAAVLFAEPDILLLDEPTNYLDLEGTLWLMDYLARYPHTVLVISHDRDLLNQAVDQILHLDQAKLTLYRGGYDQFERQRTEQQALQAKLRKKQDDERKHLQAFVDRFKAKASKAKQAQSRVKRLEKMQTIAPILDAEVLPFHFPSPERPLSPPIVAMEGASVGYADKPVLSRLSLVIADDDRIGLLGSNGNGKSTFAKLVAGKLEAMAGTVRRSTKLKVGYFAQHQLDELRLNATPYQHVAELMPDSPEARVRARCAQMGFPGAKADTPVANISGGEKARLLMGLATFAGPHLLILDEPTNHLDIDSRIALMEAINDFKGAVILISHDRFLLEACADRLWLVGNGTVKPFDDDLDAYRRLVLEGPDAGAKRKAETERAAGDQRRDNAGKRLANAPLKRRIEAIEARMAKFAELIARVDAVLAEPDIFQREPAKAAQFAAQRAELERNLTAAEEEWLALSADYDAATA
ncbi:ABC-F family ATP-binding cassette domain-containing protein [Alsobacter sp. SYSU M60028]|uniref:ABC-F family ATP-binding cassette domain-containing protein n=1 Tax=Alsobacter ponti TaxID=2962936 RepID=A0ABT1LFJ6_9HYPH|nr:ABC-F family ATP-binding cassette domain-containing protein [Alsobacter ponti]MCP8940272.1 ABC-F family ATP-binding cassette domain-containing protein [Alsobacter ponti]